MYQQTGLTIQDTASSLFDVLLPFITFVAIPFVLYLFYKFYTHTLGGGSYHSYKGSSDYSEDVKSKETKQVSKDDDTIQKDTPFNSIEQDTSNKIILSNGIIQFPNTVKLDK